MDNSILRSLRGSKVEREKAIGILVKDSKLKNGILKFVRDNSGENEDGIMVFSDSILAFAKQVFKNRELEITSGLHNYVYGIARFLWLKELRKRKKIPYTSELHNNIEISDNDSQINILLKGEKAKILKSVLSKMKVNCKEVLFHWANGYKMKEVSEIVGYKTEGVVRKKKSECLKELLEYLDSRPNIKEQLRR